MRNLLRASAIRLFPLFTRMGLMPHVFAMEILMFPLKLDLLFPSLDKAKAAARSLNTALRRPPSTIDPRELQRMKDELRIAREKVRLQSIINRNLFL